MLPEAMRKRHGVADVASGAGDDYANGLFHACAPLTLVVCAAGKPESELCRLDSAAMRKPTGVEKSDAAQSRAVLDTDSIEGDLKIVA
jgi:hypothetical protein